MTIHATVLLGNEHIGNLINDPSTGIIVIPFIVSISNPSSASQPSFNAQDFVTIPLGLNAKKSDDAIRKGIADFMLSLNTAYIIKPEDIYFPMAS